MASSGNLGRSSGGFWPATGPPKLIDLSILRAHVVSAAPVSFLLHPTAGPADSLMLHG